MDNIVTRYTHFLFINIINIIRMMNLDLSLISIYSLIIFIQIIFKNFISKILIKLH